jgi:hypothetical protein
MGKEMPMFASSAATPQLVIIGKDSRLVFSHYGYIVEEDIRAAIEAALKEFGDLHQIEKISNIFLEQADLHIDLSQKFISLSGLPVTFSVQSNTDWNVVNAEINLNELVLTRGSNTGIAEIKISAAASVPDTVFATFKVMTYPDEAQVISFEEGESWSDNFYYLGDELWGRDDKISFKDSYSLRSGYIPAPDFEGGVNWTMARAEFYSDRNDTLAFAYKISSQYNSDGFEFCLDGTAIEFQDKRWSGEIDWTFAEFPVKAGNHTIDWDYFKWEYGSAGNDAAWIDIVRIPGLISGIDIENDPEDYNIVSNYPNPFNSSTVLKFKLKSDSAPFLTVYNIKGEAVIERDIGKMTKGINTYKLDFGDFQSGTYFYRLKSDGLVLNGKFLYLK